MVNHAYLFIQKTSTYPLQEAIACQAPGLQTLEDNVLPSHSLSTVEKANDHTTV